MSDNPPTDPDLADTAMQIEATIWALVPSGDVTAEGALMLQNLTKSLTNGPTIGRAPDAPAPDMRTELTETDTGIWVVHTSTGAQLLDLDERTVTSINRPHTATTPITTIWICKLGGDLILKEPKGATLHYAEVLAIEPWPRPVRPLTILQNDE